MNQLTDTISAIATPPGEGGIGIERMSGPLSLPVAKKIFHLREKKAIDRVESHKVLYGTIRNPTTGEVIDEVLVTVMLAPQTFTREDIVEISCHGGYYITRKILDLTLQSGVRLAAPGEFTRRAFLNGRINLLQAEGILDLIQSKSERSHEQAISLFDNSLSVSVLKIKQILLNIGKDIESRIDFFEEEISDELKEVWEREIKRVIWEIGELIRTYDRGKAVREGIKVTITGRPNVGKSSLLNRLLMEDRAIVSDIPGTTRDSIEETFFCNGFQLKLTDTAGLKKTDDRLEKEGIKRSLRQVGESDIILFLFDGSQPLSEDDISALASIEGKGKDCIGVINKSDLEQRIKREYIQDRFDAPLYSVSALEGQGIEELIQGITQGIGKGNGMNRERLFIGRRRHFDILTRTLSVLERGKENIKNMMPVDMLAEDIRESAIILGEMTGETYSEEILDRIFDEFCIGK